MDVLADVASMVVRGGNKCFLIKSVRLIEALMTNDNEHRKSKVTSL